MENQLLVEIYQLFIQFMGIAGTITVTFYFISWLTTFLLSMIFPSRYGS